MSTKINPDFYGAENTFVSLYTDLVKTSQYTIANLITNGTYTGGDLDHTAAPWGVGKSSISSDFQSQLTKGATWTIFENKNQRKNTPLWFYYTASPVDGADNSSDIVGTGLTSTTYARALYKNRYDPSVTINGNDIKSSLTVDNTSNVQLTNTNTLKPITYLNYSGVRVCLRYVYYKTRGEGDFKRTSFVNFYNNNVNANRVFGFDFTIRDKAANILPIYVSIGGSALDIPDVYKQSYYGESHDKWVRPWRSIQSVGYWNMINLSWATFNTDTGCIYSSVFDALNSDDNAAASMGSSGWGHISDTPQTFDDISYHWSYGYSPITAEEWVQNPISTGDAFTSGVYRSFAQLDLDDGATLNNDNLAKAIMHEIAFLGLPFCFGSGYANAEIGSNDIYLPVFDEHLVTTGEYVNGSASLELPNASWGDVFGVTMPDYDADYDPDAPPSPDDDYGYLDNKAITNRVYSSNNRVYALTAAQYSQFINDINSLYLDDPDTGYASFQLDFKGTNPSDYIVGTYGYTFLPAGLIPNQTPEAIQIGAVTLPNAKGYKIAPSYIYNYRSLGEIDLTGAGDFKPFGDFRDFEPYTHIELYVPLCGNIELDPAAVIGHTIQIEIIFDIMTGNATACIYRDNKTLIATVAGQLAASLPLTSGRMGDYQNAVKSAENALKQNELKTTTAAATVAMGVGAALLAPETGGLSLAAYGAAITGGASLMSLSNQKNQIEYEIKHKQPSISVCSSANGAVAQNISSMYAVCYVKQCKMLSSYNAATYAHTVGHATVKNTTIGAETTDDSNSLIVCSNADLSGIPATAAEINAIQSLLTSGIYV